MSLIQSNITVSLKPSLPRHLDAVAVLIHKNTQIVDADTELLGDELAEVLGRVLESKVHSGKSNEVFTQLLNPGNEKPKRLIVIGYGNPDKTSAACYREAAGTLAKEIARQKLSKVALIVPNVPKSFPGSPNTQPLESRHAVAIQSMVEGLELGSFEFTLYRGTASQNGDKLADKPVKSHVTIVSEGKSRDLIKAVEQGQIIGQSQNLARTIAHRPANDINPVSLAKVAQELAKQVGLKCRILDEREMAKLKMGGMLAVGMGSKTTPPRMIVLEWPGKASVAKGKASTAPLLAVGKAITFDTGGISIKPAANMQRMIFDKCGGMAVLGFMAAVAQLKLPRRVVGILAAAENHISDTAYRPGDILRFFNGVTAEITNTDAEGRLVLADALAWGCQTYGPKAVVDLATLTGGVVVALGKEIAGVMTTHDRLMEQLQLAANRAGERIWRLPLDEDMNSMLKSDMGADIVNSGGREGHPLQGAVFLSHFVPKQTPWLHMDIAGTADTEKETALYKKGATGWGVRTLIEWASADL